MAELSIGDALLLARQQIESNQPATGERMLRQILAVDQQNPEGLHLLAIARLNQDSPAEAAGLMAHVVKLAPHDIAARVNQGLVLRRLQQWEAAEAAYREAVALNGAYAPAHYGLGLALAGRGDTASGAAARAKALAMIPPTETAMAGIDDIQLGARFRIYAYLEACRATGAPVKVVLGGHWAQNRGWLILNQSDQDLTAPLDFPDASIDVMFTEHVIEHLPFAGAVGFFREAHRVLKPGGTLRTVCPMLDRLMETVTDQEGMHYYMEFLRGYFPAELSLMDQMGFEDKTPYFKAFLMNSIYMMHGHKFIWSARLMGEVKARLGFAPVTLHRPGEGRYPDLCIERSPRMAPLIANLNPDMAARLQFDPEGLVVEAVR